MCLNRGISINDPLPGRLKKPRSKGLTMVLDKGIGLKNLEDRLKISYKYIDFIKLSFGTSLLYRQEILKKKIKIIKEYNIDVYPGGTLLEIALKQNKINEYLFKSKQLGFTAIEISNGTIDFSQKLRKKIIKKARALGFKVFTEIGKKEKGFSLKTYQIKKQIEKDLSSGSHYIIIEGRESGKNISIYDKKGTANSDIVQEIIKEFKNHKNTIFWETPLKKQQIYFIKELGPDVNLGNISFKEIFALESLRRGLRGDTFKFVLEENQKLYTEIK